MKKHSLGKTLMGLALVGGAIGGAVAYLMRETKQDSETLEEEFQDFTDEDCEECTRSYTTIPTGVKETVETEVKTDETSETDAE